MNHDRGHSASANSILVTPEGLTGAADPRKRGNHGGEDLRLEGADWKGTIERTRRVVTDWGKCCGLRPPTYQMKNQGPTPRGAVLSRQDLMDFQGRKCLYCGEEERMSPRRPNATAVYIRQLRSSTMLPTRALRR